jgi:CRISPR-associated protein Cas1
MEQFRPIVADSVVIGALNTGVVEEGDFVRHGDACALAAPARKRFILAYERRLAQEVVHPVFGYKVAYRRVLELTARLATRLVLGEIDQLPAFRTR